MFCSLHAVQAENTKRDGSILIKIDKASLKISPGKTQLVEYRAAKFWLEAEAGFAGTGKSLHRASGRLEAESHWYNQFCFMKKHSRRENIFNYQTAIMCKQKSIEELAPMSYVQGTKFLSSFCLMMKGSLASYPFCLLNAGQCVP